jgi:hypothetical protein
MTYQPVSLFDTLEPEIADRLAERSNEIAQGASVNSKIAAALALGSIPIALAALSTEAFGQAPSNVVTVLQFALALEYLESDFYTRGNAAAGLIPAGGAATVFATIAGHEAAHVIALQGFISAAGVTPITAPTFDYTAGGLVAGFNFGASQYATFQALAQGFEDTGVRAYKGQAPNLIGNATALTAALTIHAVEAEHASQVRRLRGLKGWITSTAASTDLPIPALSAAIYGNTIPGSSGPSTSVLTESNTTQGGVDVTQYTTAGGTSAAMEAFDEPLPASYVAAAVGAFMVGGFPVDVSALG